MIKRDAREKKEKGNGVKTRDKGMGPNEVWGKCT